MECRKRGICAKFNFSRVEVQGPISAVWHIHSCISSVTSKNSIYNSSTPQNLVWPGLTNPPPFPLLLLLLFVPYVGKAGIDGGPGV